jgi:hypothetical protein
MSETQGRSLTRHEFDAVIRRAAELASSDAESSEGALSEVELFRIAREVGLSEGHVRTALAEVRGGVEGDGGFLERVFGPRHARASRVVPGTPASVSRNLEDYFEGTQLLQRVRRTDTFLQYRPSNDWAAHMARAGFGQKTSLVATARSIEVQMEAVENDRTFVALVVEHGARQNDVGGAIFGGGVAGVAVGAGAAIGLSFLAPVGLAVGLGAVAGGGLWSAIFFGTGRVHRRKELDLRAELEGVLDALATGASLEPPPPTWRKWVKRHLGGVARDILGDEEAPGR